MEEPGEAVQAGTAPDTDEKENKAERRREHPKGQRREKQAEAVTARDVAATPRAPRGHVAAIKRYLKLAKDAEKDERDYYLASASVLATLELAHTIRETFGRPDDPAGTPLAPEEALASDFPTDDA